MFLTTALVELRRNSRALRRHGSRRRDLREPHAGLRAPPTAIAMRWVVLCGHGRLRRASASHAKLFKDVDLDNDGMIGFREWMRIVELAGNAISADEAEFPHSVSQADLQLPY